MEDFFHIPFGSSPEVNASPSSEMLSSESDRQYRALDSKGLYRWDIETLMVASKTGLPLNILVWSLQFHFYDHRQVFPFLHNFFWVLVEDAGELIWTEPDFAQRSPMLQRTVSKGKETLENGYEETLMISWAQWRNVGGILQYLPTMPLTITTRCSGNSSGWEEAADEPQKSTPSSTCSISSFWAFITESRKDPISRTKAAFPPARPFSDINPRTKLDFPRDNLQPLPLQPWWTWQWPPIANPKRTVLTWVNAVTMAEFYRVVGTRDSAGWSDNQRTREPGPEEQRMKEFAANLPDPEPPWISLLKRRRKNRQ